MGEGRHPFYINHEIFKTYIFRYAHCSVSSVFKGGGLDFAQDGKLNFCLKFNGLKKVSN